MPTRSQKKGGTTFCSKLDSKLPLPVRSFKDPPILSEIIFSDLDESQESIFWWEKSSAEDWHPCNNVQLQAVTYCGPWSNDANNVQLQAVTYCGPWSDDDNNVVMDPRHYQRIQTTHCPGFPLPPPPLNAYVRLPTACKKPLCICTT